MSDPSVLAAVPFLFVLAIAGSYDWEQRKVPDIFLSALWLAMMLVTGSPLWTAGIFGLVFFLNTAYMWQKGKPVLAWGDILAIPPTLGVMFAATGFFWSMMWLLMTFGAISAYFIMKRQFPMSEPIVTYIAISCFFAFLPQFF